MDGIELTKAVKQQNSEIKVIVYFMFYERQTISDMFKAGVSGYN